MTFLPKSIENPRARSQSDATFDNSAQEFQSSPLQRTSDPVSLFRQQQADQARKTHYVTLSSTGLLDLPISAANKRTIMRFTRTNRNNPKDPLISKDNALSVYKRFTQAMTARSKKQAQKIRNLEQQVSTQKRELEQNKTASASKQSTRHFSVLRETSEGTENRTPQTVRWLDPKNASLFPSLQLRRSKR